MNIVNANTVLLKLFEILPTLNGKFLISVEDENGNIFDINSITTVNYTGDPDDYEILFNIENFYNKHCHQAK